jgi:hypothetical protein
LCKQELPPKFKDRLGLIDAAIATSSALHSINATNGKLKELLNTLWQEENSNVTQIKELSEWVGKCQSLKVEEFELLEKIFHSQKSQIIIKSFDEKLATLEKAGENLDSVFSVSVDEHLKLPLNDQCNLWKEWSLETARANDWPSARDSLAELKSTLGDGFHRKIWEGEIGIDRIIPIAQITIFEKLWNVY